jgi:hypothetical protein
MANSRLEAYVRCYVVTKPRIPAALTSQPEARTRPRERPDDAQRRYHYDKPKHVHAFFSNRRPEQDTPWTNGVPAKPSSWGTASPWIGFVKNALGHEIVRA